MTKTTKIILITTGILLAATGTVFAFRKKKPVQKAIKKVGSIIWPEGATDSEPLTESGESSIKLGSSGRYVEQLQTALNEIHTAALYINNNCNSAKWQVYPGGLVPVTGKYDDKTNAAAKFYFGGKQEIDLSFLAMIREKISAYKSGNKCIYPLASQ
jgi:hypothetical protein